MRKTLAILLCLATVLGLTWYFAFPGGEAPGLLSAPGPEAPPVSSTEVSEADPSLPLDEISGERVASSAALPAPSTAMVPEAPARPATTTLLTGRVIDQNGKGIPGADLGVRTNDPFTFFVRAEEKPRSVDAKTDAAGNFRLETQASGAVQLAISAGRFAPHLLDVVLRGGEQSVGDVTLSRGVVIAGMVVDGGGTAVPHAKIHRPLDEEGAVFRIGGGQLGEVIAVSDEHGAFEVDRQAVGAWSLTVTSEDHPDAAIRGETSLAGEEVRDLVVTLEDGARIRGIARDLPTDSTEHHVVRASEERGSGGQGGFLGEGFGPARRAELAADGSFDVRGLKVGKSYRLALVSDGTPWESSRSPTVTARAGESGVELVYSEGTTLVFNVVDAKTGLPITEFGVEAGVEWTQALEDSGGQAIRNHPGGLVRFEGIRPRGQQTMARLIVDAIGYERYERNEIPVEHKGEVDLGRIALLQAPTVRVQVLSRKTGEPIVGATVELHAPADDAPSGGFRTRTVRATAGGDVMQGGEIRESAVSDANGIARVRSHPGERVAVSVRAGGFAAWKSEELVLAESTDVDLEALLSRGGEMRVVVRDGEGTAMTGMGVRHRGPGQGADTRIMIGGGPRADATTDQEGIARFENLVPGRHLFQLQEQRAASSSMGVMMFDAGSPGGDDERGWTEAFVVEDETGELVLLARSRGRLVGRVKQGGAPLAGARLTLEEKGGDAEATQIFGFPGSEGPSAKSDGEGRFLFDDLAAGEYVLRADHESRALEEGFDVRVDSGENRVDLELSVAVVEGRLTDDKGDPVAGARVSLERVEPVQRRATFAFRLATSDDDDGGAEIFGGPGTDRHATTDADGRYALRGVPSNVELRLRANHGEYQPATSKTFDVTRDELLRDFDMTLVPAGRVEVLVRRANGTTAANAFVQATFRGESETPIDPVQQLTDRNGKVLLKSLHDGPWEISISSLGPGAEDQTLPPARTVEVLAGKTEEVAFDL